MSFGTCMSWRLLSLFTAMLWAIASVGFAATAHADSSSGRSDRGAVGQGQQTAAQQHVTTTDKSTTEKSTARSEHAAARSTSKTEHKGTSGDVNSPQPISHADANSGGANGQCPGGPYCSTRDGSASANGNGGGKAVGKPCAGCVGKADNKNPKGQKPDASDHNAGYECDTNHGIAKTNPAHTGCKTPPPPVCVPTPEVPCVSPPECVPTPEVPCVSPPVVSPPQGGPPTPPQVSPPTQGLPNTGAPADLIWLSATALASILAGTALLLGRRLRMTPA